MTPRSVPPIRPLAFVVAAILLAAATSWMSPALDAQTPARTPSAADRLPVRRVVLYKSGVGYFEHVGRVRGNQTVTIDFTSAQLDDALKSLTTLDLDGGRVSGISYNSEAALDRRLGALRLPVGEQPTRAQLLSALRGSKLEVGGGAAAITGRLLSVEPVERRGSNGTVTTVDTLTLVSDGGELRTMALDPGVNVRILEADLSQEVNRYLALVASERDQDVRRLTIATAGTGDRDLFVSYISEVPVWKATYRLVLPSAADARAPMLQGWAVVDNTVGEDWNGVALSLVAGAPQSFIQQISRPYYVQRPVVPLPERMLLSPQTHQAAMGTAGAGALSGTVTDATGGAIPGATVRATRNGAAVVTATTDSAGRFRLTGVAPGGYDVSVTMPGFRPLTRAADVSGGMETVLNATLQAGGQSEVVAVTGEPAASAAPAGGGGGRGGRGFGTGSGVSGNVMLDGVSPMPSPAASRVADARLAQQAEATGAALGDLFEYALKEPVTIRKNQSALVPILGGEVKADKVSLWNASTSGPRPLRAVWLTNTTGLTLDGGTFTVVDGQAFAGEGLIEPLKAGERRLLSYAMDLGLQVDAKFEGVPARVTRVLISRGLLIQQSEERQRRVYTARNEDAEPRTLVIEHPARTGWTLAAGVAPPAETTPAWLRFQLSIAPKTTATFAVEEVHPLQTQYAVGSITDQQVALLVHEQAISGPVEASLRQVIARKAEIARLAAEGAARQTEIDQIGRDQDRVRENMRALKGSTEEKQLLQRYVKQLDGQETRLDALRKELDTLTAQQRQAQADLAAFIDALSVGTGAGG